MTELPPGYPVLAEADVVTVAGQPQQITVDLAPQGAIVGQVVDAAIEHKDRLQIDAVWMQLGVEDPAAADRAREADLLVVMDTCPRIEWPRVATRG